MSIRGGYFRKGEGGAGELGLERSIEQKKIGNEVITTGAKK